MIKQFLFIILAITFLSCENKLDTPQEMILGNWSQVDTATSAFSRIVNGSIKAFEFYHDNTCDFKPGYLDYQIFKKERPNGLEHSIVYSLGTKTKYSISHDSLKIYNLSTKKWDNFRIKKINNDSLILARGTQSTVFIKKNYDTAHIPDFDAVIVSSSGCYGPCPMNDIMISNNGEVIYKGAFHVVKKGWYTSTISRSDFNKIQQRFKEANYMKLNNHYLAPVTDVQTVSISFLKDGRIVKSITDRARLSPYEFIWAYTPLITLGQKIDMRPKSIQSSLDDEFLYSHLMTNDKKRELQLSNSEIFYLVNLLMDENVVNLAIDERYTMSYTNEFIKEIKTDGRYYKLYFKNGKTQIKDIGYNFITDNKLNNKFEIINK